MDQGKVTVRHLPILLPLLGTICLGACVPPEFDENPLDPRTDAELTYPRIEPLGPALTPAWPEHDPLDPDPALRQRGEELRLRADQIRNQPS
jgi:hypothetical protein